MAWENTKFSGYEVTTGDKPIDEFALCLNRIASHYEERFERKPTVAEILYAFNLVVLTSSDDVVLDPHIIGHIAVNLTGDKNDT